MINNIKQISEQAFLLDFGNEITNVFAVENVFSYGNISSKLKSKLNEFGAINFNIIKAK